MNLFCQLHVKSRRKKRRHLETLRNVKKTATAIFCEKKCSAENNSNEMHETFLWRHILMIFIFDFMVIKNEVTRLFQKLFKISFPNYIFAVKV